MEPRLWAGATSRPIRSDPARGPSAPTPADLFADTETQRLWLGWLKTLVARWSSRPNVIAWEIFSELDLATGATVENATAFIEKCHAVVRSIDPWRPVFASTSDLPIFHGKPPRVLLEIAQWKPWQSLWQVVRGKPWKTSGRVLPTRSSASTRTMLISIAQPVERVRTVWHLTDEAGPHR